MALLFSAMDVQLQEEDDSFAKTPLKPFLTPFSAIFLSEKPCFQALNKIQIE